MNSFMFNCSLKYLVKNWNLVVSLSIYVNNILTSTVCNDLKLFRSLDKCDLEVSEIFPQTNIIDSYLFYYYSENIKNDKLFKFLVTRSSVSTINKIIKLLYIYNNRSYRNNFDSSNKFKSLINNLELDNNQMRKILRKVCLYNQENMASFLINEKNVILDKESFYTVLERREYYMFFFNKTIPSDSILHLIIESDRSLLIENSLLITAVTKGYVKLTQYMIEYKRIDSKVLDIAKKIAIKNNNHAIISMLNSY